MRELGRVRGGLAAAVLSLLVLAIPGAAAAKNSSLYTGPGPRPGPDLLYKHPVPAPQLQNAGPFKAAPILISGASAYRKGEFLYQDFLYDDHGAQAASRDPADPKLGGAVLGGDSFSGPNGTYTYPSAPAYRDNAADLVELRVKPLADATAFRITLNTLTDPDLFATTIAIGDSATPQPFPHGANASAPAELFLTVHGNQADLLPAGGGDPITPAPSASVSRARNQITVTVPHTAWDPGDETVRLAGGVGLWDAAAGHYLIPGATRTATAAGGGAGLANPTAFFNVAFRFDEPLPDIGDAAGTLTDPTWWRDRVQGEALKTGDLSPFHADVDFAKLASGARDDMTGQPGGVPTSGAFDRIVSSRFATGEGADYGNGCTAAQDCLGVLTGALQPYAIYVPDEPEPAKGYGLTLLLHSLSASYNQFSGSNNQSQLGDRGPGSIVITPEARGPDGWYYGHTGADTFEVWADVASHYHLDPSWTAISGYSMGGYGTYKFATQFPDLFARANPVVGPPGLGIWSPPADPIPGGAASNTNRMLGSLRNVPSLIWAASNDQLVPVTGTTAQAAGFDKLGYRYVFDLFAGIGHLELAANDQFGPAADFLGTAKVDRNPAHVSYVVNPTMDFRKLASVADHAYWLSGLKLRKSSGAAPLGRVDAVSRGFGVGDPPADATTTNPGTLDGGNLGPLAYTETAKAWGDAPTAKKKNELQIDARNLKSITVQVKRAKLSCGPKGKGPKLRVKSDGPLTVKLAGCKRSLKFR
jgi:hypothetical protein